MSLRNVKCDFQIYTLDLLDSHFSAFNQILAVVNGISPVIYFHHVTLK